MPTLVTCLKTWLTGPPFSNYASKCNAGRRWVSREIGGVWCGERVVMMVVRMVVMMVVMMVAKMVVMMVV